MKLKFKHQAGKHPQSRHGSWAKGGSSGRGRAPMYEGAEGEAILAKLRKRPGSRSFVGGNTPRDDVARDLWDKFAPNVQNRSVFNTGGGLHTSPAGTKNAKLLMTSDRELKGIGQPSMTSQVMSYVQSHATGGIGMPLKGGGTGYGLGNGASIEAHPYESLTGPETWWYISNG